MFVTFEGTDGSGKSTQIRMLADVLRARGHTVVATREPGGTAVGNRLRALLLETDEPIGPEAEAYLMTGARSEHVRAVIRPALAAGAIVVCDRFVDSTLAYQGAGRGLPVAELRALQRLAVGDTWPELTVLLDVPVELGLVRRAGAGVANRIDRESLGFHERVAAWFRDAAAGDPCRWRVIDGTPEPAVVHTAILDVVLAKLAQAPGAGKDASG
jgi:dTMP kinase